jgi:hypothetical protein
MILLFILFVTPPEDVVFKTEQDIDFELILKDLEYLQNNPLDINSAGVEDLAQIPFLTLNTIIKIIDYRETYGPFTSLDDLQSVPGVEETLIDAVRPYITIEVKTIEVRKVVARARGESELPVEQRSVEYYTRIGSSFNEYGIHAVTERDAYEQSFFDHYAVGLLVDDGPRKFALGKFNLDLGAGAVLSSVGSFFRGIDFRLMMNERGLIPYTSAVENGGFFGAAFNDSFFINYTLFYSSQKLDGRIDSLGLARSLDESGLHVDSLSSSRKDQINEEIFGYDVRYRKSNMLISNRTFFCNYEPAFATTDSIAGFYGDDFFISSLELRYFGESFVMFGEVARSWRNRVGGLFGFSTVFPYIDFTLAGKYFPVGFYSPKGIEATPNVAAGTVDLKHHSRFIDVGVTMTLDNKIDEDTAKYDIKLSLGKRLDILDARVNFRRRYRAEARDISGSEVLLRIRPVRFLFFDFRFEQKSVYAEDTETGIFGALEMGVDFKNIDIRARYGVFDTDSYAARIYAYEIDLPGVVNNRMLYDKGHYGFVYVALRPFPMIKVSAKYSVVIRGAASDSKLGGQFDFSL